MRKRAAIVVGFMAMCLTGQFIFNTASAGTRRPQLLSEPRLPFRTAVHIQAADSFSRPGPLPVSSEVRLHRTPPAGEPVPPTSEAFPPAAEGWPALGKQSWEDLKRFADASVYTWAGPLRWDGGDWLKLGGTIAGTALLALADEPVRDFWQHRQGSGWDAIETAGFHYGKPYAAFALTGGFYLSGVIFRNEWARETGIILGSAFLTSAAVQTLMKTAVGRARPGTNVGNGVFKPFSDLPDYHSFPSGHMQVALATALVLGRRVEQPLLKAIFYAAAGTTLVSRMHSDAHWISDLAFGGAISWFCADAVIKRMEHTRTGDVPFGRKPRISWELQPSGGGLTLLGTF